MGYALHAYANRRATVADEAVNDLKHRTRQRRRVERDQLLGVGGHEELLRRYRGNARLTDAHSRRLGKKLLQVSRWATMERALREVGYADGANDEGWPHHYHRPPR